ncbi:hypothetical protein E1B28_012473 [Marasmius oreades]|uniref:Uncharacterized protein n=1 Tax=Marasmius oreades TaxID=181124 RepID=A0A9P7RRQ7_9AGAR|nr:uncharacterized protein E1B28_012473 [Marasmius oreades]KAG7088485.1 hypothetical protein E1B28_012473 [Marasmius oreades]
MGSDFGFSEFFTVTHVVVYPIATFSVMFLTYGFYVLLFILCINSLTKSPYGSTGSQMPHGLYFWSTVSLFVIGTINVICFTQDKVREMVAIFIFLRTGDASAVEKHANNDKIKSADQSIVLLLSILANIFADLMLVHRCYIVWNRRNWIGLLFVLTSLINVVGLISVILVVVGASDEFDPDRERLFFLGSDIKQAYNGAYAGANLLTTVLTASRIWWVTREARESLGGGIRTLYQGVVAAILESGSLYPIISFVHIALVQSASTIGLPIDLIPTVTLVAGIAPALMIVRCRVFGFMQSKKTVQEAGDLSTLQFGSNTRTGTGTTPGGQSMSGGQDSELPNTDNPTRLTKGVKGDSSSHSDEEKEAATE